jgi:hypothetical protein
MIFAVGFRGFCALVIIGAASIAAAMKENKTAWKKLPRNRREMAGMQDSDFM